MAIKLQMLTEDPKEIELIERYWAVDESGQYLEKVSALTDVIEMAPGVTLASFVRQRCNAFDDNQVCSKCAELIEIKNRSEAKRSLNGPRSFVRFVRTTMTPLRLRLKRPKPQSLNGSWPNTYASS